MTRPLHRVNDAQSGWLASWAQGALRLYPVAWRERYADEVTAVLEDYPVTLWTLCDLLVGALDVRLRGDLLPRRMNSMAQRIRTSEVTIFAAFILYCMAWLPLHFVADTPSVWLPAAQAHPELALALGALNFAGFFGLFAVLLGGIPLLVAALGRATMGRRWAVFLLLILPLLAAFAIVGAGLTLFATGGAQHTSGPNGPTWLGVTLRFGLGFGGLLVLIVSAVAVAVAIRRSELSLPVARFALIPAGMATVAMVVGTLGAGALLVLINTEAQQLGASAPLEAIPIALLLAAAALASVALWRGVRAAFGGTEADAQVIGG